MEIRSIRIDLIRPNAEQPRKIFHAQSIDELAESIRQSGLIQPITVRPLDDAYEIVAGERRWRAHCRLVDQGFKTFSEIRAHVRAMSDLTRDIEAIVENMQRADISPLEEARAFQRMIDAGMAVDDLANRIGRHPWRIRQRLQLINLDPTILKLCEKGLDQYVAQEIGRLTEPRDQMAILKMYNGGTLSNFQALKAAIQTRLDAASQVDIFGEVAPRVSVEDVEAINVMESAVDRMCALAARGWKDGQCVVAVKVSRDRARVMAQRLNALRKTLSMMETQLLSAAAQADLVLEPDAA